MNVIADRLSRPRGAAGLAVGFSLALAALFAAPTAEAAPPAIVAASQASGHVTVTWQLPPDGSTSFRVQIATHPDVGGDGEFLSENVVATDLLADGQTSWTDIDALPPGIYYVHVSDSNLTCRRDDGSDCFPEQWSQTDTVQIPLTAVFAWGTSRNGHLTKNRAIAGGTLILTTWNPEGNLPPGTKGVCIASLNLILSKVAEADLNGQWTCAYRLPKKLAGKHIAVSLDVVFGTTGAFLHKTISTTVAHP